MENCAQRCWASQPLSRRMSMRRLPVSSRRMANALVSHIATSLDLSVLRAHPRAPRRQRQDGPHHHHVPGMPSKRVRSLHRARCREIRVSPCDPGVRGRRGERFARFAEHMAELYLEECSSLIPQNLLLPLLEEYVKYLSFDESDLLFFE